jgi:radical SAM protein with 4Fe4S-binding SPASM domain
MTVESEKILNIYMDQNNKCNLRCIMCGFSDPRVKTIPKYDMPYWLFEKIAREIFPHAKYLVLSCLTEPLMTKDFPQRLDLLKRYTVPFTEITTNGILLNEAVITKMIDARISRLAVSIDGGKPATYESIRVGARFDKVINNIRMFNALRREKKSELPKLRINHVISNVNIDEFRSFLDLAESLEVQAIDVRTILPFRNAKYQGKEDDSFFQKIAAIRDELRQWTQKAGVEDAGYLRYQAEEIHLKNEFGEKISCRRPWDTVAIHANGDVLPCITWTRPSMGNMAEQDFLAIWNGPTYTAIRKEFEERKPGVDCLHCTIRKRDDGSEDDCFFTMLNKRPPKKPYAAILAELTRKMLRGYR